MKKSNEIYLEDILQAIEVNKDLPPLKIIVKKILGTAAS